MVHFMTKMYFHDIVHGGWSEWFYYGECSVTCGNDGTQPRRRRCDNPIPSSGGLFCIGDTHNKTGLCERRNKACPG